MKSFKHYYTLLLFAFFTLAKSLNFVTTTPNEFAHLNDKKFLSNITGNEKVYLIPDNGTEEAQPQLVMHYSHRSHSSHSSHMSHYSSRY